ncbi:DUF1003 domain-containing protein [Phenylobacterium sp.]|uniref:DUF1003 domain-containing protein n=1 Tax=Phenylobacterium sp. TaxID=1871053 RepID=UPI0025E3A36A|nr:DUF1003 domain-containing protein [Phenylobacterium sp.]
MGERAEGEGAAGLSDHVARSVETVAEFHRQHYRRASRPQRAIDAVTNRLGRPAALIAVVAILGIWAGLAMAMAGGRVDQPIFAWLEFAATVTALVISMLILVTQRREDELAERRAQLTLELALLADTKSAKIIELLEELRRDHPDVADRVDAESDAMATPTDARTVVAAMDAKAEARK